MTLMSKQAVFYKCRDGAAMENAAWYPGRIYVWRGGKQPHTLAAMEKCGVLERLDGTPSVGFDVVEMHEAWFNTPPRPEPIEERPMKREDMLSWLGWDLEKLGRMRARYAFPAPSVVFSAGAAEDEPDHVGTPGWHRSQVERWLTESREIA